MAFDDGKKTVSGSIAHTDDAATKVPFVSVKCGIEPTLSGVSSLTETQTGRNLCPNSFEQGTFSESAPVGSDYATMKFGNTIRGRSTDIFRIDNGNVNVSCADGYQIFITLFGSDGKYLGQYAGWTTDTAITNSSAYYIAVAFKRNDNGTITDADFEAVHVMCEVGSTAHAYEPYEPPTQYTASLGRTIYGGQADIVNGTGTENCTNRNLVGVGFTWVLNTTDASFPFFTIGADAPNKASNKNFVCEGYVNRGNYRSLLQDGEIGVFNNTAGINRFCVRDDSCTTLEQFLEKNANTKITYEVTNPTDFTFTPITPTPETVGKVNNVYCNTGNTEVTYYDNAHGFSEVTVTRCGKNLWSSDKDLSITRDKTVYMRIPRGTYTLSFDFVSSTASPVPSYMQVAYSTTDGTKYYPVTVVEGRCSRTFTLSADARALTIYSSTSYSTSVGVTTVVNNIQLEVGSQASSYEPYEAVSKTAYLHKVIYGGQADVVKGTCKQVWSDPWTWTSGMSGVSVNNKGVCYINKSDVITVNASNQTTLVGCKCADDSFEPRTWAGLQNATTNGCACVYGNGVAIRIQGYTTKDEYEAYLAEHPLKFIYMLKEPITFSFPPISISTDEGENTLFANEGDSAITYRKAVD